MELRKYRLVALTNAMYELFTSMLTSLLTTYDETHQIQHYSQEGFR